MIALSLILVAAPAAEQTKEKPGIAVMDMKAVRGVDPELTEILNEVILLELKDSEAFSSVIGDSDIRAMVALDKKNTTLGCEEDSCLAELGGVLGVPFMVQASLGKVGANYVFNFKIVGVDDASVQVRNMAMVKEETQLTLLVARVTKSSVNELVGHWATLVLAEGNSVATAKGGGLQAAGKPPIRSAVPTDWEFILAGGSAFTIFMGSTILYGSLNPNTPLAQSDSRLKFGLFAGLGLALGLWSAKYTFPPLFR